MKRLFSGLEFFAAFAVPAAIWAIALILFGIYPFGEKSILITDMGQQYIEYRTALYGCRHWLRRFNLHGKQGSRKILSGFCLLSCKPFHPADVYITRAAITESVLF